MREKKYQMEEKHQQQDMNFFRGNYAGNKSTDKENYFFSSRAKDDLTKAKPKLLTGRLPAAFKVQGERRESEGDNTRKAPSTNSIDQSERYSTEGNVKQQKYKLLYKQKMDLMNQFNSENSDNDKVGNIKHNNTSSTRPKTESDIENDKGFSHKPVQLRGSSANSHKVKSTGGNITLDPVKGPFQLKSVDNLSKTQTFIPPKMMIEAIDYRAEVKSKPIKDIKSKPFALEEGFTYYSNAILKHYFHVPFLQLFFLKEYTYDSRIIEEIANWRKLKHSNFLQIQQFFINNPEGCITVLIEYPFGFSINEIINSTGIASNYLLNKIARNCLNVLSLYIKESNGKDYGLFCQCDLYYNAEGEMKMMPSITSKDSSSAMCQCKQFLNKLARTFKVNITHFFSLGFILLRSLTGNIQLRVYELLFLQPSLKLKCCLMHTLLLIEDYYLSDKDNALLSHFLKLLPGNCIQFICELLSFNSTKQLNYNNTWLNSIAKQRMILKVNELLRIAYEDSSAEHYIEQFIHKFNIAFMNLGDILDLNEFIEEFKLKRKEMEAICKLYDITNINSLIDRIKEGIISNNMFQYK